jgi:L-2,4-diaminobutyric acid acetyltransferase
MGDARLAFRPPRSSDAAQIWSLVPEIGLEQNSCYAYLLLCSHFADTGLVAEARGEISGFVLGYRPPTSHEQLFVWQIGVAPRARGTGLAGRMLSELLARHPNTDARFLSATVSPDNAASLALFRGVARRAGVTCTEAPCFPAPLFPSKHPDENLLTIGPLPAR